MLFIQVLFFGKSIIRFFLLVICSFDVFDSTYSCSRALQIQLFLDNNEFRTKGVCTLLRIAVSVVQFSKSFFISNTNIAWSDTYNQKFKIQTKWFSLSRQKCEKTPLRHFKRSTSIPTSASTSESINTIAFIFSYYSTLRGIRRGVEVMVERHNALYTAVWGLLFLYWYST